MSTAGSTRGSRHGPVAQLLIAWSPLSTILVAYLVAAWVSAPLSDPTDPAGANRLGFALHVLGPARADEALWGTVPSVWLQERWAPGGPHWYDAVAALTWVTHFVSIPLATALVWFRLRDHFRAWLVAVITFTLVGIAGYVVYPAAPPWWASQRGRIGDVERISTVGWDFLGLGPVGDLSALAQAASNPVAAMPSLHAGAVLLIAGFLVPLVARRWALALAAYVVLMAATLVYTGEHYVVDVLAGWAVAALALAASRLARLRRTHRADDEAPVPERLRA